MKSIEVVYLITDSFYEMTLQSIDHILKFYKKSNPINFNIIHTDRIKNKFKIESRYGSIKYKRLYSKNHIDHLRVGLPSITNLPRYIFMDSDTFTTTCISKLWDHDLNHHCVAACQSSSIPTFEQMYTTYYEIPQDSSVCLTDPYFNTGVMIVDSNKWCRRNIYKKCQSALKLYSNTNYRSIVEPAMNIALHDQWLQLDESWNYRPRGKYKKCNIIHNYGQSTSRKPRHNAFIQ